jgi:hypothetical protein
MTLIPAYGRDYTTGQEAIDAYLKGKDWIIADVSNPYNGKYCSCRDFPDKEVNLRYNKLRDVAVAKA